MGDLISRKALLEKRCKITGIVDEAGIKHGAIAIPVEIIKRAPSIDAVPVVRCYDCDNWDRERMVGGKKWGNLTAPCSEWSHQEEGHTRYTLWNGFCSYGERRSDHETD